MFGKGVVFVWVSNPFDGVVGFVRGIVLFSDNVFYQIVLPCGITIDRRRLRMGRWAKGRITWNIGFE